MYPNVQSSPDRLEIRHSGAAARTVGPDPRLPPLALRVASSLSVRDRTNRNRN